MMTVLRDLVVFALNLADLSCDGDRVVFVRVLVLLSRLLALL